MIFRHAEIHNWVIMPQGFIYGEIYADSRQRFPDGHVIKTSLLKSPAEIVVLAQDEGKTYNTEAIVETQNTVYALVGAGSDLRNEL